MARWIEAVPNVSEGRRDDVIDAIADAVRGVAGVRLLDIHKDVDHNRSVFTFVGPPPAVCEAAFRLAKEAVERIDLTKHAGVHPRLGAADVVPLVPLEGVTLQEAAFLARGLARRIEEELKVKTALYSGAHTEGKTLPEVRREAPEGHPTAGVTCVGARRPLIAFNVELKSNDLELAKRIANEMRRLPDVRALGFLLESRGRVQVSMNLLDYTKTSPARAFLEVKRRAGDVGIERSEIVGMIPRAAVEASFSESIACESLAVLDAPPSFLDGLAEPSTTPGGGAAAAYAGAMAAGLVSMCCGITGDELAEERARAEELREQLAKLANDDAKYYAEYTATRSQKSLKKATVVPLFITEKSAEVLLLAQRAGHAVNKAARPDLQGAMRLATAAVEQGQTTTRANLPLLEEEDFVAEVRARLAGIP